MDQRRFDAFTRLCAQLIDRREGLAAALTLSLAALLPDRGSAAKKHHGHGGKGGGKGGGHHHKHKHRHKNKGKHHKNKKHGGGVSGPRNCDGLALTQGADLANCDLRQHPGLASADFTNAKLEDAIISGANLNGISFRGARLWRAKLDGATLSNAHFDNSGDLRTDIFGVDFSNANLRGATLDFGDVLYVHYAIFCHTTMPNGEVNDDDC